MSVRGRQAADENGPGGRAACPITSARRSNAMKEKSPKREAKAPKKDIKEKRKEKQEKKAAKGTGGLTS